MLVDNLMQGLSTTLVGMLIVFFGLLVLIICITIMHKVMQTGQKAEPAPEAPAAVPEPAAEEAEPEEEADDGELIAVITAAVAAVWDNAESGFVVRRVRRVNNSPKGAQLARDQQMYSHF